MAKPSLRVDQGEFEQYEKPSSLNKARAHFLQAVASIEPTVLSDLRDKTADAYLRLPSEFRLTVSQFEPPLEEVFEALRHWGQRWHLEEQWCLNQAFETLRYWEEESDFDNWAGTGIYFKTLASPKERRFIFEYNARDLTECTRKQIKKEIREALEMELEAYLERMEGLARERGFAIVPEKFTSDHYEWLAYFQVIGLTYDAILQRYEMIDSQQAIQKAVTALSAFIGLPLRGDRRRPGRPAAASRAS
jgi:hypothetical protein